MKIIYCLSIFLFLLISGCDDSASWFVRDYQICKQEYTMARNHSDSLIVATSLPTGRSLTCFQLRHYGCTRDECGFNVGNVDNDTVRIK